MLDLDLDELALIEGEDRYSSIVEAREDFYFYTRYMYYCRNRHNWLHNWHHQEVADALMKVYRGEITRLIINEPPRYSKTQQAVVDFMSWCMGKHPDSEFIHTSYSARLAINNSFAARETVLIPEYREIFPNTILRKDSKAKDEWHTTAGGKVYATGNEGTLTGYGAGKKRPGFGGCFPFDELVSTEVGMLPIGRIVEEQLPVRVWSFNFATGLPELQPIDTYWHNPPNEIVEVGLSDGHVMRCTPNHKIATLRGWVEAKDLRHDDLLPCFAPDAVNVANGNASGSSGLDCANGTILENPPLLRAEPITEAGLGHWVTLSEVFDLGQAQAQPRHDHGPWDGPVKNDTQGVVADLDSAVPLSVGQMGGNTGPCYPHLDLPDHPFANAVLPFQDRNRLCAGENRQDLIAGQFGTGAAFQHRESAVPLGVEDVLGLSAIGEVSQRIVGGISVEVPNFDARQLLANEGPRNSLMDVNVLDPSVDAGTEPLVSLAIIAGVEQPQRQDIHLPGLADNHAVFTSHAPVVGNRVAGVSRYRSPLFVKKLGHVDKTYCLEVRFNHNFYSSQGAVLVSNCIIIDDPIKPTEAVSDTMRANNIDWYSNTLASRVNSPHTPIILIMQRLHENDLSGWLLAGGSGEKWEHLCIPAINDAGEALWPATHTIDMLRQKETANPYEFAGQYMQRPAPKGGGLFKEANWKYWREWSDRDKWPTFQRIVQSWDTAFKDGQQNDYSVCTTWGETATHYYIIDIFREKLQAPALRRKAKELADTFKPNSLLIEDKASGQSLIQDLRTDTRLPVIAVQKNKDKIICANEVIGIQEAGKVVLPEGHPEVKIFVHEHSMFPNGAFDDTVDSHTQALKYMVRGNTMVKVALGGI